jgi:hypothetical protein
MFDIAHLPSLYAEFVDRWTDRNDRMQTMLNAVTGHWSTIGPDDEDIENRSPNLIQVALEDTAEAASLIPTVRVAPSGITKKARDQSAEMERMAISFMEASQVEVLTIRSLMDLIAYGMFVWVVVPDPETGAPLIQWRDPMTCFPEPGMKTLDSTREALFARELYLTQLPAEYQARVEERYGQLRDLNTYNMREKKIILVEYFTEDEIVIAALYQQGFGTPGGKLTHIPIELDRMPTIGGICPVIVGQRITLDNEPRGQFDQVLGVMQAHIRLMGMVLDYADQAVYSDVWVKDLIGPLNFGGGSYIQLGPQGAIGRVQPAVSDLAVFREMDQLVESLHLGGRWPKVRPGQVDQSIASAKFLEASAGMMNTVIRTLHLIMKNGWERALRVCFVQDSLGPRKRTVSGVLRNQQFMAERDVDMIDLKARIRVEYGLGLGRDPAQSMVLGIQASQAGLVSTEFVQENFEGITDLGLERIRLDTEKFHDMALAQILQGLEQGTIPQSALVEMAKARQNGDDIFDLYKKYVVAPQEEQREQQMTSGLTGDPMMPGMPQDPGMMAPSAPPIEELLGALGGGGGMPGGPDPRSRINVPLGDGGFVSSNT